jgi:hypothetical protein
LFTLSAGRFLGALNVNASDQFCPVHGVVGAVAGIGTMRGGGPIGVEAGGGPVNGVVSGDTKTGPAD